MKLRKWIAGATCVCMLLTLSPPAAVLAETMPQVTNSRAVAGTPYWDWDAGQKKLVEKKTDRAPQEVRSTLKEWSAGWYIVDRDVILDARVIVTGKVHLILADGVTLTVNGGIQVADDDDNVANGSANALTIYGQAKGSGALKIEKVNQDNAGIGGNNGQRGGAITINGGAVTGANGNYGIGGKGANVTINGGALTATARYSGIGGDGANVTINGGTVTAGPPEYSGCGIEGASVAVNGGTVTASGTASGNDSYYPGIKGGTVTIGSGTVIATGGVSRVKHPDPGRPPIRSQGPGIAGDFNTTSPGNAIIVAQSGIEDKTHKQNWKANIIIDGSEGTFNVNPFTLTEDFTIPEESHFVVPIKGTLVIPSGVTLTNKGTLTIDGHVDNSAGTIDNQGAVAGSGTLAKKVNQPAPVLSEITYWDLSLDKFEECIHGQNEDYLVCDAPTGGNIIRDQNGDKYIHKFIDQGKSFYVGKKETAFCYASDGVLWFENTGRHPMPTLTYDADQGGVVVPRGYKYLYNQRPSPEWPYENDNGWQEGNGQLVKVEWGKKLYVYRSLSDNLSNSPIQEIAVGTAPDSPQVESVTATTVTLQSIPPDAAGAPVEYSKDNGQNWQDSPTFTGLTPDTEYTFIARYKAHNGQPASANSFGTSQKTAVANYELTVTAPTLEETYGYSQPAAKALTINCTGNIDATIQSVTLGADSKFEIVQGTENIPMNGENTSWKVQPKAGLDAGTYTDTITVTDQGGKTATAEVKLTVNKADATVDTPPTAIEGLKYTGEEQVLIAAGTATGGELQYSLSEDEDTFKKELPTGNKAGSYRVFYRVKGDANHNDSKSEYVVVKIVKAAASITEEPKGKILTYNGQPQELVKPGVTSGGELQYSLKENRDFSTDIPKGTDAGDYTVYYRIVGDSSTSGQGTVWSVDTTIDKATAEVKQAPNPVKNLVYTGNEQTLITAGTTNGCTLQYSTDGKTYSKELPKATDAGDYTVWYKVEGEKNYTDVAPQSVAVKIAKATPKVTVTAAQNLSYTGKAQALIEVGTTSGGTLQYSLTEKGDYSTTIPQGTNAGTYTVWYKVVGGDNYNDVAPQSVAVTIQPANAVVTEPQAKTDLTYNGKAQALLTKGETNGGKWQYSTDGNTYQEAVPMATDAGTYTVHYKLDGEGNVNDIPATSVSVTIKKADPQVTAPTAKTLSYTGEAQALVNAGTTNGGTLQYSLTENGDYSTTVPTGTNADTYTVYYKVVGDKNYNDVAVKSITVTIDKATPTVTVPQAKTLTYTGEAQALITAGTTTGGTLKYSLDDQTYSTDIPQGTEAKTYTVYYKVVGNTNYKDVAPQSVKVTIAKAAARVDQAPTAVQDLVYNGQDQALINAGTAIGGTMQYSLKQDSGFSANIPTGNAAKEYTVYYKVVGDANHADSEVKSVTVIIAKATPTVDTPSGLTATYGDTLKDVALPTSDKGTWAWKLDENTSVGNAGKNTFVAVFTPKDATNYNTVEKTVEVTVAKATPKVEVPSGLTATYGQTLKDVKLPSNEQGAWAWETPGQSVGDLGTKTFQAIYTPKDTANYNTVEKMVEVTVGKATMEVETPSGLTATYGDTLKDVALPTSDKGAWKWNDPLTTPVGDVGDRSFKATFTPTDTNYNPVEKTVTIAVKQATPTVEAPTGLTATYGQTLKDVKLPSAEWAWKDSAQSVGNVGPHDFVAIYTPADTNYKAVEKTVTVTVKQAEPSVQVPTDLTATYGDTLADVKLPSAEWAWKDDEKTSVGDAGKHEFVAIYTPADKNYKAVEKSVTVTVKQATPKVEAPSGLTAAYGDTLKSVALPTSDKGTWAWKDSTQSVGDAGTNTFVAVYTPNDKNYKAVDVEVGVTVEKATPQVTAPTGITASYGQTLQDVVLPSNNQGAWTWETPSQSVGALGEKTFQATFTPKDSKNYTTVTMAVTVTVKQAAAKVTKAPQAVPNLTYSGQSFDLITAGEATGGKLQYRLGEQGDYKDAIPQAKEAGTYAIYYKVKGDTNHSDLVVDTPIQVTIAKAPQTALKAPEAESVTRTAITLKAVADSANGIKAEYGIKTGDGSFKWQANPAFDNLSEGTNYTFKVRYAESANYLGAESAEAVIRTDRTPSKPVNPPSKPIDPPTVPDVEGGDVTVTPSRPTSGQTVTITPQPEEGMVVDKVIVTDKNGNKIEVTQKPNGDFTFEQPSSEVTVTVTFKPEGEEGPSGDLPFNDVPEGAWYEDAVEYVYENGLIMGVADGQFAPNMTTDRGQLVTMLWRLAGEPQAENSTDFGDVPSSAYYAKAVAWAAENGITAGFEDGTFRPTTGLSREQMAALFMKYAQAIGLDTSARADISGFTDINPDSWSYDALSWAKAVGLLNGVGDATMAPQDTATRAQIAAVLQRYCETIAK